MTLLLTMVSVIVSALVSVGDILMIWLVFVFAEIESKRALACFGVAVSIRPRCRSLYSTLLPVIVQQPNRSNYYFLVQIISNLIIYLKTVLIR